jgi:enoyl-CoA hydratase/carnithine racemase
MGKEVAPEAAVLVKRLLWQSHDLTFRAGVDAELGWMGHLGQRPDATEGIRSFMDKRDPAWSGRPSELPDAP